MKNSTSKLQFGLLIFVALLPLTFTFSQNEVHFLLDSSFKYVVWSAQTVILLVLLLKKSLFTKIQLWVIAVLYVFIPFTFTISNNEVDFLILNRYTSSIISWSIAGLVFSKLLFYPYLKPFH